MHSGPPAIIGGHGKKGMEREWVEKASHVIVDETEIENKPLYAVYYYALKEWGSQGWLKRMLVDSVRDRNTTVHVGSPGRRSDPRNCCSRT
jgi:hypothetical protein